MSPLGSLVGRSCNPPALTAPAVVNSSGPVECSPEAPTAGTMWTCTAVAVAVVGAVVTGKAVTCCVGAAATPAGFEGCCCCCSWTEAACAAAVAA